MKRLHGMMYYFSEHAYAPVTIALKEDFAMREKLLDSIYALLEKCEDLALLDFILKLLQKSR